MKNDNLTASLKTRTNNWSNSVTSSKRSKSKARMCVALSTAVCIQPACGFGGEPVLVSRNSLTFQPRRASLMSQEKCSSADVSSDTHVSVGGTDTNSIPASVRYQTRLWYRDGDSEDSQERKQEHDGAIISHISSRKNEGWWSYIFSLGRNVRHNNSNKQENMDRYLEFLDRRYNRLHSEEMLQSRSDNAGISTAWNWLFDTSGPGPAPGDLTQSMQDDALYILGVAELASERLLQKHQHNYHHYYSTTEKQEVETPHMELPLDRINKNMKSRPRRTTAQVLRGLFAYRSTCKLILVSKGNMIFKKVAEGLGRITIKFLNPFNQFGITRFTLALSLAVISKGVI